MKLSRKEAFALRGLADGMWALHWGAGGAPGGEEPPAEGLGCTALYAGEALGPKGLGGRRFCDDVVVLRVHVGFFVELSSCTTTPASGLLLPAPTPMFTYCAHTSTRVAVTCWHSHQLTFTAHPSHISHLLLTCCSHAAHNLWTLFLHCFRMLLT